MATAKKQSLLLRRRRASMHNRLNKLNFEPEHLLSTNGAPLALRTVRQLMNAVPRALCRVIVESGGDQGGLTSSGTGMLVKLPSFNHESKHYCGLLTNNHVLDETSVRRRRWRLVFDETGARVDPNNPKLGPVLFGSSRTLDFTFLYLPECKLFKTEEYLPVAPERDGTRIVVVQHPNGGEMSLSYGEVIGLSGPDLYHTADTMGGSSGSPLVDEFARVVGLHKAGSPLTNVATRMTYIIRALSQSSALITDFRKSSSGERREYRRTEEYNRASSPPPPYSPDPRDPVPSPSSFQIPAFYPSHRRRSRPRFRHVEKNHQNVDCSQLKKLFVCQLPFAVTPSRCAQNTAHSNRLSTIHDLEMFEYQLSRLSFDNRLLLPKLSQGGGVMMRANDGAVSSANLNDESGDEGTENADDERSSTNLEESDSSDRGEVLERATIARHRLSKCTQRRW